MRKLLPFLLALFSITSWAQEVLNESFEGGYPPAGWKHELGEGNTKGWIQLETSTHSIDAPHTGAKYLEFESYNTKKGKAASLYTPMLDLSSGSTSLSFYTVVRSKSDGLHVDISTDGGQNWTEDILYLEKTLAETDWTQHTIDLAAYNSHKKVKIRFRAKSSYSYGKCNIALDDVSGPNLYVSDEPPTAVANPSPANEAAEQGKHLKLSWSPADFATGYRISIGTSAAANELVNNQDLAKETSFNTPALASSTTYYWKVVPYNAKGDATGVQTWSFSTMDDPSISTFPWGEGFEAAFPASGWKIIDHNSDGKTWKTTTYSHNNGDKSANLAYSSSKNDFLVTPPVAVKNKCTLEFYAKGSSYSKQHLSVKISETGNNYEDFTINIADQQELEGDFAMYSYDLSAYKDKSIYIAFCAIGNNSPYLDDVRIFIPKDMEMKTAVASQDNQADAAISGSNLEIMKLELNTEGRGNPITVNKLKFNTNGTTTVSDLNGAKVYFTADKDEFSTASLLGELGSAPSGEFEISGTQALTEGKNYFWLAYDVASAAKEDNLIDAEFVQLTYATDKTLNGSGATTGSRSLKKIYNMATGENTMTVDGSLKFFDDGGAEGKCTEDFEGTVHFVPANAGKVLKLNFSEFEIFNASSTGKNDIFRVYNGKEVREDKLIGQYSENPGALISAAADGAITVYFKVKTGVPKAGWKATVEEITPVNMTYASSDVMQTSTETVAAGDKKVQMLRIEVNTENTLNPLTLTDFNLALGTTTKPAEVVKASVYYTGNEAAFSDRNLFGEFDAPTTNFKLSGSQALKYGKNYFWLCYDLSTTAENENKIDAACESMVISTQTQVPATTNPAGDRSVKNTYEMPVNGIHTKTVYAPFTFTDDKADENYTHTAMSTVTFEPANAGEKVKLTFAMFELYIANTSYGTKASFKVFNGKEKIASKLIYEATHGDCQTGPSSPIASTSEDGCLTVQFVGNAYTSSQTDKGWEAQVTSFIPSPMKYKELNLTQNKEFIQPGSTNQLIIGCNLVTEGTLTPIQNVKLNFSTDGTTANADISSARVYYTGRTNKLSLDNQLGDEVDAPDGDFSFSFTQELVEGANYFWLVYDLASSAKPGNHIDASCMGVEINSVLHMNPNPAVAGSREVKKMYLIQAGSKEVRVNNEPTIFYDDGGVSANYSKEFLGTVVFVPEADGEKVRLEIPKMDIATMEEFLVYNGGEVVAEQKLIEMDDDQNIGEEDHPYVFKSTSEDGKLLVRFESSKYTTPQSGWEATVRSFAPQAVYYEDAVQKIASDKAVVRGEKNARIVKLGVHFKGETTAAQLENLVFNTTGTTNLADIASAKLFYTNTSNVFDPVAAIQYGETIEKPGAELSFEGTTAINGEEYYYFWLAYDVAADATAGNKLNASCTSIKVNGKEHAVTAGEASRGRTIKSGLKGNFTIGKVGDYVNFTAAAEALKAGVEGPVVFNVKSDVYVEKVAFEEIQGASASNTITFKSESGIADDVVLVHNIYTDPGYDQPEFGILTFAGADFVRIENITIKTSKETFPALVLIRNHSTDIVLKGNKLLAPYTTGWKNVRCVKSEAENIANRNNDRLSLINNYINGGYYGLSLSGTGYVALPKETGHIIKGNRFENQASKALWVSSAKAVSIENNLIVNSTTTKTSFSAIECYRIEEGSTINNNNIRLDVSMREASGLKLRDFTATEGNEIKIYNNTISVKSSSTAACGIVVDACAFVDIDHNTVKMTGTKASRAALFTEDIEDKVNIRNNIFINEAEGSAIYLKDTEDLVLVKASHNNLYVTGTALCKVDKTDYAVLSDWQALSQGENSISETVAFYSDKDLHLKTLGNLNAGKAGLGITKDMDDEDRDANKPCMGADEFTQPSTEAPVFATDYPRTAKLLHNKVFVTAKLDQIAQLYFVCLAKDAAAPTVAQVMAGTNAADEALAEGLKGSVEVFKNREERFAVSGLEAHSEYDLYLVAKNNLDIAMNAVHKLSFMTAYLPTMPSTFEAVVLGSTSFDDGTAHFEGVSVVAGEGIESSAQFAQVAANTKATVSILNTDAGIQLDGCFVKTEAELQVKGKKQDGTYTDLISMSAETDWTYLDLRPLGEVVAVEFLGNTTGFSIDDFSGLPLALTIQLDDELSINEGESATLAPVIKGGVKPYTYQWTPANSLSATDIFNPTANPTTTTRYQLAVTDKYGTTEKVSILVSVKSADAKTATFEEINLAAESYIKGDPTQQNSFFYSGSYTFNNFYAPSYATWSGFAISNETSTEFSAANFLAQQFRSAGMGGVDHSGNYATVYAYGFVPEITLNNGQEQAVVKGTYITNNAYAISSMKNGDSFVGGAFAKGDYYKVYIIGYDKNGTKTATKEVYLADYRSDNEDEHYMLEDWKWIDLTSLGEVKTVRFTVEGSRNNHKGLLIPAYFCIDNFNGEKVDFAPYVKENIADLTVEEDAANTTIDLSGVFTDTDNDDAAITKSISSSLSSDLFDLSISGDQLVIDYKENQFGSESITVEAISNGKTVSTSFRVTVKAVDDAPIVKNTIEDITLKANPEAQEIELAEVFSDADGDKIVISVSGNTNTDLVSASISESKLNLDITANKYGEATITIEATANAKSVETSFKLTVQKATSVDKLQAEEYKLYPNPCKDRLYVSLLGEKLKKLSLFDMLGNKVFETELNNESFELPMSSYQSGIYILHLETETKKATRRIIKQ